MTIREEGCIDTPPPPRNLQGRRRMIPQVNLDRVTPVVVAPLGASGASFATLVVSSFLREGVHASIDRRSVPLGERIRTLHESGNRVFFCGVGDEEVRLQMVRVKVDGELTDHLDVDSAVEFVKARIGREPEPAEAPHLHVGTERVLPSGEARGELVAEIVRRADGTLALRGEFTPELLGELVDFFRRMAAVGKPR